MKGINLADILVDRVDGIEAAAVVTLRVLSGSLDGPVGALRAVSLHVEASSSSRPGVGPHYHELATGLRELATALERRAEAAGYRPIVRIECARTEETTEPREPKGPLS